MSNMTRAQFVTELQARGWSRFTATELHRYLDWALQALHAKAKFPESGLQITTAVDLATDQLTFTAISGLGADNIGQIVAVYAEGSLDEPVKLRAATSEEFSEYLWPNSQSASPSTAETPAIYYVYDQVVFLYPKPEGTKDIWVHWLGRDVVFTGDGDTSGLPERFDKALLSQAEVFCYRRAHEVEGMAVAQLDVDNFLLDELGSSGLEMAEKVSRVVPWRG